MKTKPNTEKTVQRKTLVQLAGETTVRDPAAHAKHQVEELDKTAKHSQLKRKKCTDQIEADTKEIAKLEEQIAMLKVRYIPLCENLADSKAQKKKLMDTLEHCMGDQKTIMGNTKGVILGRRQEENRMTKKMGSLELEILRGYNLNPESTFYQSKRFGDSTSNFNNTGSSSTSLMKSSGGKNVRNLSSSAKTLPPLNHNSAGGNGMPRNNSSMI